MLIPQRRLQSKDQCPVRAQKAAGRSVAELLGAELPLAELAEATGGAGHAAGLTGVRSGAQPPLQVVAIPRAYPIGWVPLPRPVII